jgi:ribosomal protein S16
VALGIGAFTVGVYNPVSAELKQRSTEIEAKIFAHHQFELPAELKQGRHRAEQDREGQDLLGHRRGAVLGIGAFTVGVYNPVSAELKQRSTEIEAKIFARSGHAEMPAARATTSSSFRLS